MIALISTWSGKNGWSRAFLTSCLRVECAREVGWIFLCEYVWDVIPVRINIALPLVLIQEMLKLLKIKYAVLINQLVVIFYLRVFAINCLSPGVVNVLGRDPPLWRDRWILTRGQADLAEDGVDQSLLVLQTIVFVDLEDRDLEEVVQLAEALEDIRRALDLDDTDA